MVLEAITIILPLPPKILSPNCTVATIGGRFAKAAAIKKVRNLASEAVEAEHIDTIPWKKVSVGVTFYHKDRRRRDQDNAMGSLKAIYDGIVDSGLVGNDDYEHMQRESPGFRIDTEYPRVQLEITRLE